MPECAANGREPSKPAVQVAAVELLASTEGVGYLMVWSRQLFQLDVTIAMMFVIGIVGFVMDKLLAIGERRLINRFGGAAR